MKLFYSPGACSLGPHIALLEAQMKFELDKVDLRTKIYSGGDFKKIIPRDMFRPSNSTAAIFYRGRSDPTIYRRSEA